MKSLNGPIREKQPRSQRAQQFQNDRVIHPPFSKIPMLYQNNRCSNELINLESVTLHFFGFPLLKMKLNNKRRETDIKIPILTPTSKISQGENRVYTY
jgi:hypothetical protein